MVNRYTALLFLVTTSVAFAQVDYAPFANYSSVVESVRFRPLSAAGPKEPALDSKTAQAVSDLAKWVSVAGLMELGPVPNHRFDPMMMGSVGDVSVGFVTDVATGTKFIFASPVTEQPHLERPIYVYLDHGKLSGFDFQSGPNKYLFEITRLTDPAKLKQVAKDNESLAARLMAEWVLLRQESDSKQKQPADAAQAVLKAAEEAFLTEENSGLVFSILMSEFENDYAVLRDWERKFLSASAKIPDSSRKKLALYLADANAFWGRPVEPFGPIERLRPSVREEGTAQWRKPVFSADRLSKNQLDLLILRSADPVTHAAYFEILNAVDLDDYSAQFLNKVLASATDVTVRKDTESLLAKLQKRR